MREDWRDMLEKRHIIPGSWPCERERGGERERRTDLDERIFLQFFLRRGMWETIV
jgi:hypothetical protein